MKIKEFKGFRCKYGLNLRVEFPVFFVLDLFLGEMGRGYGKLPLEDNRVCPWTERNAGTGRNKGFLRDKSSI